MPQLLGSFASPFGQLGDLPPGQVLLQGSQSSQRVGVLLGCLGLLFERLDLAADFAQQVAAPGEVGFHIHNLPLGLFAAAAMLQHACRFFQNHPKSHRACIQRLFNLALRDDGVLRLPYARIR